MISAKVIEDSIWNDKRITSLQLTMPRFILAQFNTHRAFSRSTASSRAIPTQKLIDMVKENPVLPVHWGQNQAGMQAGNEMPHGHKEVARMAWLDARDMAVKYATELLNLGAHKQLVNRVLEPYMWSHTIVTATEWENFFELRLDDAAQPEIQELARRMAEAMDDSVPVKRNYHLPYITEEERSKYEWEGVAGEKAYADLGKVSAARCARVSYLNHDQTKPDWDKDVALASRLAEEHHWSPYEHPACAFVNPAKRIRNFVGWVQYRSQID